jgi:hypothetical protein
MAREERKRLLVRIIGEDLLRPGTTLWQASLWNLVMNAKRFQMNIAIRPPAKAFAKPLSRGQMLVFKKFLPGEVNLIGDIEIADW